MKYFVLFLGLLFAQFASAQNSVDIIDVLPGPGSSHPLSLTEYKGRLYFYAFDSTQNQQIWSTDGVNPPVKTISVGPATGNHFHTASSIVYYIRNMAELNGLLYFVVTEGGNAKIYSYNGSTTAIASNIVPGGTTFQPTLLLAFNQLLYFKAYTPADGDQLYSYNPANKVTSRITALQNTNPGDIKDFFVYKGKLMIINHTNMSSLTDELWEYNPKNNTTIAVTDNSSVNNFEYYNIYDDTLYLGQGSNGSSTSLYQYSGSGKMKSLIRMPVYYNGYGFTIKKDIIYFYGSQVNNTKGLFGYDINTHAVATINDSTGQQLYTPKRFIQYMGATLFSSYESATNYTNLLWRLNGTASPTYLTNKFSPSNEEFIEFKGRLYYQGYDTSGDKELHRYTNATLSVNNVSTPPATMNLYPNPAHSSTTLQIELQQTQTLGISITDIHGRIIYTVPAKEYGVSKHNITIPTAQLSAGIYFYRINDTNGKITATGKVVKE